MNAAAQINTALAGLQRSLPTVKEANDALAGRISPDVGEPMARDRQQHYIIVRVTEPRGRAGHDLDTGRIRKALHDVAATGAFEIADVVVRQDRPNVYGTPMPMPYEETKALFDRIINSYRRGTEVTERMALVERLLSMTDEDYIEAEQTLLEAGVLDEVNAAFDKDDGR